MKVTVKLFATLRKKAGKEVLMDLPAEATPKDILEKLNISREEAAIIMINGRGGKINSELAEADVIAIFPLVGGG